MTTPNLPQPDDGGSDESLTQPADALPPAQSAGALPPAQPAGALPPAQSAGALPPAQPAGALPPAQSAGALPPAQSAGALPPATPPAGRPAEARPGWLTGPDLKAAALVVGVLLVLGVLAGLLWSAISKNGQVYITETYRAPLENEDLVSADARFAIITGVIGILAGPLAWFWRAHRGQATAAALGIGGLLGASLTALVGHLIGGGRDGGAVNTIVTQKLSVQAHGLLVLEPFLALLVYLSLTLLSGRDDLGRADEIAPAPSWSGAWSPGQPYPGQPYPGQTYPGAGYATSPDFAPVRPIDPVEPPAGPPTGLS